MNSYSYKNNIGWLIVLIICLLLLGGCIVLNVLLLIKVKFKTKNMTDIKNNFERKPLYDLTVTSQECPSNQEVITIDRWPGTVDGCDCGVRAIDPTNEFDVYRKSCGDNKGTKCRSVSGVNSMPITKWEGKKLCVKKIEDKTFLYYSLLFNSVKKGKECQTGYKQCGILDSEENILCLPNNEECPINDILIQDSPPVSSLNYHSIQLTDNKAIYYTTEAIDKPIIVSFKLSDGRVCIDFEEYNSQQTHPKLDYYEYYGCRKSYDGITYDDRYEGLDAMNKYKLLYDNGVIEKIKDKVKYPYDKIQKELVGLYKRTFIGYNADCLLESKFKVKNLSDFKKNTKVVKYLNMAMAAVVGINFISMITLEVQKLYCGMSPKLSWVNVIIFLLGFGCGLTSFYLTYTIKELGKDCSDKYSKAIMDEVDKSVQKNVLYSFIIMCANFLAMVILLIYLIVTINQKQPENGDNNNEGNNNGDNNTEIMSRNNFQTNIQQVELVQVQKQPISQNSYDVIN